MAHRYPQILEHALLHDIVEAQVALPLGVAVARLGVNIGHAQILGGEAKTRHIVSEVVAVLAYPGLLAGTLELVDLRVGDQVGSGTAAVVQIDEVAVATHLLITDTCRVVAQLVGEHRAHCTVVDFTAVIHATGNIAIGATAGTAVGAMGVTVEVAQVGHQLTGTQVHGVDGTDEVLVVVILQLAKVVLRDQVIAELGITTHVLEAVHVGIGRAAADAQAFVVGRVAAVGLVEVTGMQGQVIDLPGGQHRTAVGLRQQAAVVANHDRQVRLQSAAQLQYCLGNLGLGSEVDAAEVVDGTAVILEREHGAGATAVTGLRRVGAAGIQADTRAGEHVQAETDRSLGIAGIELEHEALTPLAVTGGVGGVLVVAIEIQVAQAQVCLGVLHETAALGDGQAGKGQQASSYAGGNQGFLHHATPQGCYSLLPRGGRFAPAAVT